TVDESSQASDGSRPLSLDYDNFRSNFAAPAGTAGVMITTYQCGDGNKPAPNPPTLDTTDPTFYRITLPDGSIVKFPTGPTWTAAPTVPSSTPPPPPPPPPASVDPKALLKAFFANLDALRAYAAAA